MNKIYIFKNLKRSFFLYNIDSILTYNDNGVLTGGEPFLTPFPEPKSNKIYELPNLLIRSNINIKKLVPLSPLTPKNK